MPKEEKNKKDKTKKLDLDKEVRRAIWVILLLALFLVSLLSLLGQAGTLGHYTNSFADWLLGQTAFLLPLLFAVFIFLLIKRQRRWRWSVGLGLLLISFFGLISALDLNGGRLGSAISYPLEQYTTGYVSLVISLAALIIALLILFNLSLSPLFKRREKIKEEIEAEPEPEPESESESESEPKKAARFWPQKKPKIETTSKDWQPFNIDLLDSKSSQSISSGNIDNNKKIIQRTLTNFGIEVEMGEAQIGPTVTQYTFRPAMGIKLSRITALHNDLALALAAHPLRIEAPIPGQALVGIEVPNQKVSLVRLGPLLRDPAFKKSGSLALALGRNVAGKPVYADLRKMPHLLVAGATGAGKTVALNAIILSLLYRNSPTELNLILIDPKRVELVHYNGLPHLSTPVIMDHKKAVETLNWLLGEMEDRFKKLQEAGVRDIENYSGEMPYIVVIIDELADLMSVSAREVEATIVRLAQMARAVGIHLIVSTQRPSVNVITGLIKANITSRLAFQVASQVDSRTILDMAGAEKLLGNGDMLFLSRESAKPRRVQGALVSEKEVKQVTKLLRSKPVEKISEPEPIREIKENQDIKIDDDLYDDAKGLVIELERASASLLQRHLRVGYSRAARLLDLLESKGIIGPHQGSKPRKVLIPKESAGIGN